MNPITNLHQGQNKVIVSMGYDSITTNVTLIPGHCTILPDPSIVDIAISSLALASIEAQSITAVPNQTPCIVGTCAIDVSVTWINNGGSGGTFVPNITIDGNPVTPAPYLSEQLGAGLTITKPFTVTGLTAADHTICPSPNTPIYQEQTVDIFVTE